MITIAWRTLHARRAGFFGSFVALALGVGLFAAAGLVFAAASRGPDKPPRWYLAPSVVVAGPERGGVTPADPDGRFHPALPPGERGFVPAGVVAALTGIGGSAVVVEHVSSARFGAATEAHPWAASALHPFTFVAGGPPTHADHVVLTAPVGSRVGEAVTVATVDGPRRFTVSGIIDTRAQPALYLRDDVAARLAGDRVAAVVLRPAPGTDPAALADQVRAALGGLTMVRVLTGDDRRGAELDAEAGLSAAVASLAGSVAGLAGFVAVYIVAGTFAFTVTQRRREFALLRAAGATPGQVRRLVLGEAVLVGVPAGLAGLVLGAAGAPGAARWLAGQGLAPAEFRTGLVWWPLLAAFVLGLVVAVAGAWLAARRAGQIRPVEAIGEAAVDRRGPAGTIVRWVLATACLGAAVPVTRLMAEPAGAAYLLVVVMLLILGATLVLPVLMRPVNLLGTAGRGPIAMLARASSRSESRRYAAGIAPVLVTIGLAGGTIAGTTTITTTEAAGLRHHLTAPMTVRPSGDAAHLPSTTADRLRGVPGVATAAPVKATSVFDERDGTVRERSAWYVDGATVSHVLRLPAVAGSFDDLTDGSVAVSATMADGHGWHTGAVVTLWMGDGAPARLRIAAVVRDRLGLPTVFLPWSLARAHATTPAPDTVFLTLTPRADRATIAAAVAPLGAALADTESHLATLDARFDRLSRLALFALLGVALVYTAIAIANTQLIAAHDRIRELRTLRALGATRHQIISLVRREGLTVAVTGTVLGCGVTAATLVAVRVSLGAVSESVHLRVPWLAVLAVAAGCTTITLTAGVVPAHRALRESPATRQPPATPAP